MIRRYYSYICCTQYVKGNFCRFYLPLTDFFFQTKETKDSSYRALLVAVSGGVFEKYCNQGLGFRSKLVAALWMF